MTRIIDGGVVIVIATAWLFALSIANINGFLSQVGVERSFVQMDAYQILYNAIFVILPPIVKFLVWLFSGLTIFSLLTYFYSDIARSSIRLKRALVRAKRKFVYRRSRAETFSIKLYFQLLPLATFVAAFFLSLLHAEYSGNDSGRIFLSKIEQKDYDSHRLVSVKGYSEKIHLVTCGVSNCAGVLAGSASIVYFENRFLPLTVSNPLPSKEK